MPIEIELLNEIKISYQLAQDSGSFIFESKEEENAFWSWFKNKANVLTANNNLDDLEDDFTYVAGNCYGNSQVVMQHHNKNYFEGFVLNKDSYLRHGFNFSFDQVQDFTVHYNKSSFREDNGDLPDTYIGIRIPMDFVRNNRNVDFDTNYINIDPLLLDYYRSLIN